MDFLWLGLNFFLLYMVPPSMYMSMATKEARVHVQIKGMARKKPLLVQRVPIFLCRLKYPIFRQNSPEKQKLSPVAKPMQVVRKFTS